MAAFYDSLVLGCNLVSPKSRENKSTTSVDNCADNFPIVAIFPLNSSLFLGLHKK